MQYPIRFFFVILRILTVNSRKKIGYLQEVCQRTMVYFLETAGRSELDSGFQLTGKQMKSIGNLIQTIHDKIPFTGIKPVKYRNFTLIIYYE